MTQEAEGTAVATASPEVPATGPQGSPDDAQETSFTQETQDAAVAAGVAAALTGAGREAKTLADQREAIETREKQHETDLSAFYAERDRADTERLKDEPDALATLRINRQAERSAADNVRQKADLDARTTAQDERDKVTAGLDRERIVNKVATELNVSSELLLSHGGVDEESIRNLAKSLPKNTDPINPVKPDSGRTQGGGDLSNEQKLKTRYPSMNTS